MTAKYSIALIPSKEIVELVDSMKKELSETIGWFNSKNSKAHITIAEFKATEEEAEKIISKVKKIANSTKPVVVTFNSFDSFANGAFYIAPNDISETELKAIMKSVQEGVPSAKDATKNANPHISIARRLDKQNLKIAFEIFKTINISFNCDRVAIRVFNGKQYDIMESFPFNANPSENGIQTSLF
jgi:2'-5' RNA ligase